MYGNFGRVITKKTVIYGVYIRFWPTLRIYSVYMAKKCLNMRSCTMCVYGSGPSLCRCSVCTQFLPEQSELQHIYDAEFTVLASPAYLSLLHQDLHARLWPALLVCRCYTSRRISPGNTARKSHQQQRIVLEKNTTDRAALTCTPATAPQAPSTCRCSTSMRGSWWSSRRTGCTRTDRPAWHGTLGSGSTPPSPPFRPCTATEMRIACLNKYPQAVRLVHDSGLW